MSTERRLTTLEHSEDEFRRRIGGHDEVLKEHDKKLVFIGTAVTGTAIALGAIGWIVTQAISLARLLGGAS